MKKVFLFLFLSVPCLVFGQATITIGHNSPTPTGAIYVPSNGYAFQESATQIHVGKTATNQTARGRGYLEFNLSSKLTQSIVNKTSLKAELVFNCGAASNNSNHAVKISILFAPGNPGLHQYPSQAYSELNTNIDYIDTVTLKQGTSSIKKTINKSFISSFYTPNPLPSSPGNLPISLVHNDENNNGIIITKAELVITYWDIPSAPQILTATNVKQTSCTLGWCATSFGVEAPTMYTVYYREAGSSSTWSQKTAYPNVSSACTSITISQLTHSKTYEWRVNAQNPEGVSGYSDTMTFTTLPPDPSISGPSIVCYKTSTPYFTYNASNWQNGYTWETSSNISIKSGQGTNTLSVSAAMSSSSNSGWVSVKNSAGDELKRYNVWVGIPKIISLISSQSTVNTGVSVDFYADHQGDGTATWSSTGSPVLIGSTNTYVTYAYLNSGNYSVTLQVTNQCGFCTDNKGIVVQGNTKPPPCPTCPPPILQSPPYPNPASDILNIEIDGEAIAQTQSMQQTATDGKSLKTDPTYDIRLYDGQGNLLRQTTTKGSKVEFNVANLPNGIYYLHIYDGISATPEIQQIMVEH